MQSDQPAQPAHPLPAMATFELSRFRDELERALRGTPIGAPSRQQLQQRLAEGVAERQSRADLATGG